VAKILVADDNSNIQKMVGLALKDHGIEVVAVGNGEAAVRKISDIKPDLVLADVFMPVRNGYEVCKYVKEDSTLAHIPVILLVGAFDPLDEQEAQRVGADGVLKKPFVPPDPLISMVKAALVRAGVAHAGFTPVSAQPPVVEAPPEPPPKRPTPMALPQPEFSDSESFVEDLPAPVAALKIDSGSQPLAFGSMLETPAQEEPADVTTAQPEMQRDWRSLDEAEEEEEPATTKSSWRRDAGSGDEEDAEDRAARPAGDWRNTVGFEAPDARSRMDKGWTPTREKQDLSEAAGIQETMTATLVAVKEPPAVAPFAGDAWAAAISAGSQEKTAVVEAEKPIEETRQQEAPAFHAAAPAPVVTETSAVHAPEQASYSPQAVAAVEAPPVIAPPAIAAPPIETPAVETEKPSAASSWFSTPPSPWDAEAKKANQLASTWDSPVVASSPVPAPVNEPAASSFEPAAAPDEIEVVSEAEVSAVIPAAAVETLREEASHAVEQVVEQVTHQADAAGAPVDAREATQDALAHLDMDAVVAKVLARMSPNMLQEVTREILKPVVEAIVREEMASKKH
jgi:CheY-like chemotaxis protein